MPVIIQLCIPIGLIALAMLTGTIIERRHFKSISRREEALCHIALLNVKELPVDNPVEQAMFVSGSVVISIDYFKRFLAGLRNIVGGEVHSYESILDRGRREAVLRMKEQFPQADLIVNFRIETSSISKGSSSRRKNALGSAEVYAYGTAVKFAGIKSENS